jgi:hypothetical protein
VALVVIGSSKLWMKNLDDLFITRSFFLGLGHCGARFPLDISIRTSYDI